ncbi:DUF4253 domain-containing protein [Streptomyces europaeiscabiei]|uniref:DUF4253 domain-containing protein n=1 Tax=Streptomyces europaeiscabiei TaxID=146819 RepID=UPI0029BA03B8|nr:DUF4253 domain-containing protein [Streptomyces europaeiscabiei]MDX3630697.1 DUF4253 domain-containing protein [Streptomyces europaeiscabiei]MDX3648834.1 DUF4253 domain-containing protein [Streptomyces europaeiscabiei]
MPFPLPDGLPGGRFTTRGPSHIWISDEFPRALPELWPRLLSEHEATGLLPVLYRDDSLGEPVDPGLVDDVRLENVLAADFAEYRRRRLPLWTDPTPEPVPEDVEPWPHDPGPPFDRWPGPAPAMPVVPTDPTPMEVASGAPARLARTDHGVLDCSLVLVPARRGSDALALLGWNSDAPLPLLCALLRSWEERFGAHVVAVHGGTLNVSVARPPRTAEQANLLALEHVLSTADNIVDDPPTPFPVYAADLVGRDHWSFWWD